MRSCNKHYSRKKSGLHLENITKTLKIGEKQIRYKTKIIGITRLSLWKRGD